MPIMKGIVSLCVMVPEIPCIVSWLDPSGRPVASMVRVTVAGNEFTEVGFRLQVVGQSRFTVPENPSSAVTVIGPLVVVLPWLTLGNGDGSLSEKLGFVVTVRLNEVETGEVPCVAACKVTV